MKEIVPEYEFSEEQLNEANALAAETGLETVTAHILYARGVNTVEKVRKFMHPGKANFLSPFLMRGMKELADAIAAVREKGGEIVVFGDYDADGICSSAIMHYALKEFGVRARIYVPERADGYGLSRAGIDRIFAEGVPDLFMTVDCGVSCKDEVAYIRSFGAEAIVTDHHELPEELPDCVIVNPKNDDDYPYDNLCGAGVAFKVACALLGKRAYDLLDFAALATVADSVPLLGENRDIVTEGLKLFNADHRTCFTYLLARTKDKQNDEITAQTLAFTVAPRVNAAGRMGDSNAAYALFIAEDEEEKREIAAKLCAYNVERQKKCDELYAAAKKTLAEKGAYSHVIMLTGEDWNAGFVGIVAARIADEFNRPTLIFVRRGDMLRGSARSVENVNIYNALRACSDLMEEFGGHAQAAGVNLKAENFAALEVALDKELGAHYSREDFIPRIPVAEEMTGAFSPKLVRELVAMEPYGVGHKKPLFSLTCTACNARAMKPGSPHLSMKNEYLDFMYFSGAKYLPVIDSDVKKTFVFELNVSEFRGREYVKGFIRDFVYDGRSGKNTDFAALSSAIDGFYGSASVTDSAAETNGEKQNEGGRGEPKPLSGEEIRELIEKKRAESDWGLCLIASESSVLKKYPYLADMPCDLFYPSSRNVGNVLLLSPLADVDLSGFETIVYLDTPMAFAGAYGAGKKAYYNADVNGKELFENLRAERGTLVKMFMAIRSNAAALQGENARAMTEKCGALGFDKKEFLFAARVFEELGILDFSFGAPTLNQGAKTDLSKSALFEAVRKISEEKLAGDKFAGAGCGEDRRERV